MPRRPAPSRRPPPAEGGPAVLRIVGGTFRGRKLAYSGDPRVRPMKDRVREAVFNLVGPGIRGTVAVDLFAGSGAVGLEALSRGAVRAVFVEQHRPTAAVLRRNVAALAVGDRTETVLADAFAFIRRLGAAGPAGTSSAEMLLAGDTPWAVFVSPPWDFFVERREAMRELIATTIAAAPPASCCVVEADERFDPAWLPNPSDWNVRRYPPAVVCLVR